MNNVSLITDGKAISGWNELTISRSISQLADSYKLTFSDAWVDQFPEIYVGLKCQVMVHDKLVITGFIDDIEPELEPNTVRFSLSGRSSTGDLVDCDRIEKPFTWKNINLLNVASRVCEPFGIKVSIEGSPGDSFAEVSIDQNESIHEFIDKLARQRQFMLLTEPDGNLKLTHTGNTRSNDSFIYGENLHKIKGKFSFKNRFSDYTIKAQQKVKAGEEAWGDKTISIFATAKDEVITRYRPKMLTGRTQMPVKTAQQQVNWEAQIRQGRSNSFTITHPSWVQENGDLWKEDLITYVKCPLLRLDADFLLDAVDYTVNAGELFSSLTYVSQDTYAPNPKDTIKKVSRKNNKYGWGKQ